jgi:putative flippase GtrA
VRKTLSLASLPQFVRFCIAGAIGFCVDSAVLYAAIHLLEIGPYFGRVVSYLVAATSTWYLNRTLTFPDRSGAHKGKEWLGFVAWNCLGGAVNYCTYVIYLRYSGPSLATPSLATLVVGVALGACAGLLVNYTLSRHLVFTRARVTAGP